MSWNELTSLDQLPMEEECYIAIKGRLFNGNPCVPYKAILYEVDNKLVLINVHQDVAVPLVQEDIDHKNRDKQVMYFSTKRLTYNPVDPTIDLNDLIF